jgi:glutathione S-transferase
VDLRKLSLYQYDSCPYCRRVRDEMRRLDISIEIRDVQKDRSWRDDLIERGGMSQVPCLRIRNDDGSVTWMYESLDIIAYLRKHFSPA